MATKRSGRRTRTGGKNPQQLLREKRRQEANRRRLDIRRRTEKMKRIRRNRSRKQKQSKKNMIIPLAVVSPMRDSLPEFNESPLTASPMVNVGDLRVTPGSPTSSERRSLNAFDLQKNNK
jgi:hypothetical protein